MSTFAIRKTERASRKMIYLRDQYLKRFPDAELPLNPGEVAAWAYQNGLWKLIEVKPEEVLRRKLCRAFRHEYITDPQGRDVIANVPQVIEVNTPEGIRFESRFFPIFQAPPNIARQHFALERKRKFEEVYQMKLNFDSYNDNNEFQYRMEPQDYNFQRDLDDLEQPTEYMPDDPESEEAYSDEQN